jgi:hypothetical protein
MTSASANARRLAPRRVVVFAAVFLALGAADRALGWPGRAASLALVLAIAVAYPFVVRALGVAPPRPDSGDHRTPQMTTRIKEPVHGHIELARRR